MPKEDDAGAGQADGDGDDDEGGDEDGEFVLERAGEVALFNVLQGNEQRNGGGGPAGGPVEGGEEFVVESGAGAAGDFMEGAEGDPDGEDEGEGAGGEDDGEAGHGVPARGEIEQLRATFMRRERVGRRCGVRAGRPCGAGGLRHRQ